MEIRANYEPGYQHKIALYGYEKDKAINPITTTEITERYLPFEPFLRLEKKEELQLLFNDLWHLGLRPTEGTDEYKSELKAMRNHLNDMRALVFTENKRVDLT
ncbi:MAG: hypothetical protein JXA96_17290 [Sedimentisphaerales bacterium]|nr:hypothetical protein [Sedimentisphaerales bacterium]